MGWRAGRQVVRLVGREADRQADRLDRMEKMVERGDVFICTVYLCFQNADVIDAVLCVAKRDLLICSVGFVRGFYLNGVWREA